MEVMIVLPQTTKNIGELLSQQNAIQKKKNRDALLSIIKSIKFLCRQGLALRGGGDGFDGNFQQLLLMKAEEDSNLAEWLKRKENVYTSPEIQNEMIKTLGIKVLRDIASDLQNSPFICIMVDETTDISNREQSTIVIRWVAEDFQVYEEFIGVYNVPSINSATLVSMIKDVMVRMNLSINRIRGQCYDGASAMKGSKGGVATQIRELEPRAVYTHCYGHSLNLAASDTLKESKLMKDALDTTYEITKLIKYSPRRDEIFRRLKEDMPPNSTPGIRILCPTRWTVKANSLSSIISNYEVLQCTWEEAVLVTKDTESKVRIRGVSAQMKTFSFIFGAILGEMILRHADNLSSTLQHKSMSAAEGQQVALMTVQTLKRIRSDESFDSFWVKVNRFVEDHEISEPELPRQRKRPRRYEEGSLDEHAHESPKYYFKQHYFEALDLIINCILNRFDQPGYKIYSSLETLLMKSCKGEDFEDTLNEVCAFYKDDFDRNLLHTQLQTFSVHFQKNCMDEVSTATIFDLKKYFSSLSSCQAGLISQVSRLMQLVLVMPATNATSERSFSALRRVKSYLRSTTGQERLNYLMLLHVHSDKTDKLDLKSVLNDFVQDSAHRSTIFSKF